MSYSIEIEAPKPIVIPDINACLSYGSPPVVVRKTHKKKKDPSQTLKPRSPFIFFTMKERVNLDKETSFVDIAQELGHRWQKIKEENSAEYLMYLDMANKDIKRYKEAVGTYW